MTSRLTLRDFALAFALIGICTFFALRSPQFLSARNLSLLVTELAITATLAMGMLLVILPGHIDLSAGSGVGLIGGIAAVLAAGGGVSGHVIGAVRAQLQKWLGPTAADWLPMPPWPPSVAMLVALAIALLLWSLMGALIVRERIPAFIITLGGLLFFKGLFWLVIDSHTIPFAPSTSPDGVTSIWLHLGSWQARVWEIAREAGGDVHVALNVAGHRFPLFTGTGNHYAMLATSFLAPLAGHVLAAAVVLLLGLGSLRGRQQRRRFEMPVDAGEIAFLRWFVATQGIFLFVFEVNQYRGIPLPALIFGLVAAGVWVLTNHTTFGRYLYAIGGNEEAAIVSGVPVQRVTIMAFVLMGLVVAITGLLKTANTGTSTTTIGELMELDAVAACVIGGVSLKGGRGHVMGVLFGALIMVALINGMTLLAVREEHKLMARGLVLILAVWMDVRLSR